MAAKANIVIDQGSDFSTIITISDENDIPVDITDYTFAAKAKKHYTSSTSYSFVCNVGSGSDGELLLSMTANTTSNIAAGRYVYDCEMTDSDGKITRILEGILTVTPQVTT